MKYLLAERYTMEAPIGRGPVGTVWRARDEHTRETLAVKLLDPLVVADAYAVERFQRERYALTAFLHPSLVRVRDLIIEADVVALVTEFVAGTDLRRHLAAAGPMTPVAAVEVAATLAEALAAAHEAGVVHCGLKPTNVLLDGAAQVRVTDCRVARLAFGQDHGRLDSGSAQYLAPEMARGGPPVAPSDVYSLGTVLLEMLTSGPDLPRTMPATLGPVLEACLAPEPRLRPTAAQVAAMLRRVLPDLTRGTAAALPVLAGPPRHGHHASGNGAARRPYPMTVRAGAAAVGVVVASAAVLAVAYLRDGSGDTGGPDRAGPSTSQTAGRSGGAASATQSGPGAPPTANPSSAEGGISFVRYWFDALNHAVSTGSTTELQAASSPDCQVCGTAIRTVRDGFRDGASLRGGSYVIREVEADGFWNPEKPLLQIVFDRTPRSAVGADGTLGAVLPAVAFVRCQVVLVRGENRWLVREVLSNVQVI